MTASLTGLGPEVGGSERARLVGVSLKMYFGYQETLDWCGRIGAIAAASPSVMNGQVRVFVLPAFPLLVPVIALLRGSPVAVGAQNLYWEDRGAFTGEVSGGLLAELGCRYVAVGHAERRGLFGESDRDVALKVEAAIRNGLCPIVCVGETGTETATLAAVESTRQVETALSRVARAGLQGPVVIAYEPRWAIGRDRPAPDGHIIEVCSALLEFLERVRPGAQDAVIYGGSAGPGLLQRLGTAVDGLFLGRYAHDPAAFQAVVEEAGRVGRNQLGG